jgi:hypothetical protein
MQREDAILLDFVRDKIDTFVKWDLVRFFHDNPYAANTAENIAHFVGRDPHKVEQELRDLVGHGVLEINTMGDVQVFRFVKTQEIRDLIGHFVLACDDRDFRVRAINLVIEGLQ